MKLHITGKKKEKVSIMEQKTHASQLTANLPAVTAKLDTDQLLATYYYNSCSPDSPLLFMPTNNFHK